MTTSKKKGEHLANSSSNVNGTTAVAAVGAVLFAISGILADLVVAAVGLDEVLAPAFPSEDLLGRALRGRILRSGWRQLGQLSERDLW